MEDSKELLAARDYCSHNDANKLRALLENSSIKPNDLLSSFKYKITRIKVPLLCVCVIGNSIDCAKLLINAGANVEIADGNFFFNFFIRNFYFFSFIQHQFIGLAIITNLKCYLFFLKIRQSQILRLQEFF